MWTRYFGLCGLTKPRPSLRLSASGPTFGAALYKSFSLSIEPSVTRRLRRALDFAHVAMVHGRDVAIVPGDCDGVPSCCADDSAVSETPLPINAGAYLESPGFGGSHVAVFLARIVIKLS